MNPMKTIISALGAAVLASCGLLGQPAAPPQTPPSHILAPMPARAAEIPQRPASDKPPAPTATPAVVTAAAASQTDHATQIAAGPPAFEVASMKATAPADRAPVTTNNGTYPSGMARNEGGPGTSSPGRWTCANVDLSELVVMAWDLDPKHLANASSMSGVRFDIVANVPPNTSRGDFNLMIQRLLMERIGLAVHHEQREIKVQELTVAKGGLKMKAAEPAPADAPAVAPRLTWDKDGNPQFPPGRPRLSRLVFAQGSLYAGRMRSIDDLAKALAGPNGEMVIDKTGLNGKYDFNLRFCSPALAALMASRAAAGATPGAAAPEPSASWPPLEAALLEQLGLQLHPAKALIDFLVVDRFNKTPTDN
jgi:uncharacterized protein (TIGR03435 family)